MLGGPSSPGVITMTTTTPVRNQLTDRYVAAVLAGIPEEQRTNVEQPLRASIHQAVEVRTADGSTAEEAEKAALTALGDPMRVAAGYTGRPLHLIGPAVYPDYVRLLRLLLMIVVPIVGVVVGAVTAVSGATVWNVLLTGFGTAFTVGVQLAFWVTVVFAVVDRRVTASGNPLSMWDLDDLPEPRNDRITLGGTVASVAGLAVLIWLLLWQPGYQETFDPGGASIPVLDPSLSQFWIPFLVIVLLGSITLEIVTYLKGRWTPLMAGINTVLSLAFAIPAVWLLVTDRLFNAAFVEAITVNEVAWLADGLPTLLAWLIAVVTVIDIVDGWRRALRSRIP